MMMPSLMLRIPIVAIITAGQGAVCSRLAVIVTYTTAVLSI